MGELTRAAYGKWVAVIGREPMPMQADPMAAIEQARVDVLDEAGRLLALIETHLEPGYLWVESLAVRPAAQGHGFGRQLVLHAEGLARAAGLTEVQLLTNPAFAGNLTFYQGLGYQIDRQERFRGGSTACLSKRLTQR